MTFGVFASMELEIRWYFSRASSRPPLGETETELQVKITSNDDIKFYWSLVSAGWEEEEGQALLEQIKRPLCNCSWVLLCFWMDEEV